jgi:hypothetical protein
MVDYRDQFLFLNAGNFLSPENVGNFHNRPEPDIFYGGRPNNIIRKIEKKKILWLCHLFYPPYFFLLFCPNVFSFFSSLQTGTIRASVIAFYGAFTCCPFIEVIVFLFLL